VRSAERELRSAFQNQGAKAGEATSKSSGANEQSRERKRITLEWIHSIVGPALIEHHRHSVVYRRDHPIRPQLSIVNVTWG